MVKAAHYRVRQFFQALFARVSDEELKEASRALSPATAVLFRRMSRQDQRHGLEVYRALHRAGHTNPHLLEAALLHDVGKSASWLPPWQRAIFVLMGRFTPHLLARASRGDNRGWRRPFVTYTRHAEIGARWVKLAGCSPLTVALVRRHEEPLDGAQIETEERRLLILLRQADNSY